MEQSKYDPIKFKEMEMKVDRIMQHHEGFKKAFNDFELVVFDFKLCIKEINTKIDKLPERVRDIELERAKNDSYINNFVKPFFIFFIGMVSTYVFQNFVFARSDEKHYNKTEVKK